MKWMMSVLKVDKLTIVTPAAPASSAAAVPKAAGPGADFLNLVRTGTAVQVQAAIDKGADVNAADENGKTALMYAASENPDIGVITALYNAGAKVGVKDNRGATALIYAGMAQKRDFLIALAQDMEKGDQQVKGSKDFFQLVKTGTPEQVQAAISAGAKADDVAATFEDDYNVTPLNLAAQDNPNPGVITVLVKAGAKAGGDSGVAALLRAAQNQNPKAVMTALLSAGAQLEYGTESVLVSLATGATPEMISFVLSSGAKVNFQNAEGQTALMNATWNADSKAVELLLNAGAKSDLLNKYGRTALMIAAQGPHPLGGPRADNNKQDAKTGLEIVRLLVKAGAKIDIQDKTGQTALMSAAQMQRPEVVKLLLSAGANKKLKDSDGKTYEDYSR
ncbi:MAG: ankyrin repeat domain-containing protein [Spirochaetia bacterium]